jgi:hypothetical protein
MARNGFSHHIRRILPMMLLFIWLAASATHSAEVYYDQHGNQITKEQYDRLRQNWPQGTTPPGATTEPPPEPGTLPETAVEPPPEPQPSAPPVPPERPLPHEEVIQSSQPPPPPPKPVTQDRIHDDDTHYAKIRSDRGRSSRISAEAQLGTLGLEAAVGFRMIGGLNLRLGAAGYAFNDSYKESGIEYDYDITFITGLALLDWHPMNGHFRISAGAAFNGNEAELESTPKSTYQIGYHTYSAAETGTLRGEIEYDDVGPYVGVGWGNAWGRNNRLSLAFDLGLIYQGQANVRLTADGTKAYDPVFQTDLKMEQSAIEDTADNFEFYPVVTFGISYKF